MTMTLLPNEQVVLRSHQDALSVTTHRVVYSSEQSGSSRYTSITLDQVSSCGLVTTSHPLLLLIAAATAVLAFVTEDAARVGAVTGCVLLIVAYFVTREAVIKISSTGGDSIVVPTKGTDRGLLLSILNNVDAEILRRRG